MRKLFFLMILCESVVVLYATEKNLETLRNDALIEYYKYTLECIKEDDNEELTLLEENQTFKHEKTEEFEKILDDLQDEMILEEKNESKKMSFIHSKICKYFIIPSVVTAIGGVSYYCLREHDIIVSLKNYIIGA